MCFPPAPAPERRRPARAKDRAGPRRRHGTCRVTRASRRETAPRRIAETEGDAAASAAASKGWSQDGQPPSDAPWLELSTQDHEREFAH